MTLGCTSGLCSRQPACRCGIVLASSPAGHHDERREIRCLVSPQGLGRRCQIWHRREIELKTTQKRQPKAVACPVVRIVVCFVLWRHSALLLGMHQNRDPLLCQNEGHNFKRASAMVVGRSWLASQSCNSSCAWQNLTEGPFATGPMSAPRFCSRMRFNPRQAVRYKDEGHHSGRLQEISNPACISKAVCGRPLVNRSLPTCWGSHKALLCQLLAFILILKLVITCALSRFREEGGGDWQKQTVYSHYP